MEAGRSWVQEQMAAWCKNQRKDTRNQQEMQHNVGTAEDSVPATVGGFVTQIQAPADPGA